MDRSYQSTHRQKPLDRNLFVAELIKCLTKRITAIINPNRTAEFDSGMACNLIISIIKR